MLAFLIIVSVAAPVAATAEQPTPPSARSVVEGLKAEDLFDAAVQAEAAGDTAAADTLYRALAKDPDPDFRHEARFRHARMLAKLGRLTDAAVLLRAVLDEKPDAQRVRLELAAVLARMGDRGGAARALRAVQAGSLPPEVATLIDQYSAALRSLRPYGASVEIALAPSTNINRATNATTLDTVIAPFELSQDARARSGTGLRLGGQGWLRLPVGTGLALSARLSGQASLYRQTQFNDVLGAGEVAAEGTLGKTRLRPLLARSYRWFGGSTYAVTDTVGLGLTRSLGGRAQIEVEGAVAHADYRVNDLQDGQIFDASIAYERAFSARSGAQIVVSAQRQRARDPGYATTSGGVSTVIWREAGPVTLFANIGVWRLEGDARLALFPERRREWLIRAVAGGTLRRFRIGGFAPLVRLSWERNASTVGIYDYRRFGAELGVTRAF